MTTRDKNIVGEVLAKTYRIERFLGAGTVGTVYVARHVRSGGLYAVKVLHRRLAASADVYQRFQDEARLVATLRHPHILPITDFDRDESGVPFFVMDLLEGESLAARLKHKETLPFAQTMELLSQVGSALHAAHRSGIVHRNLRPENIFLVRHDLGDRVVETTKVTDFGLACFRRPPGSSRDVPPTVYNAPEQFQEGAAIDGRVDQWALAALAYRLLSGKAPFDEGTAEELVERITSEAPRPLGKLMPDLPPAVVAAIHRGMARRREDRYETTLDFVRAIGHKSAPTGSSEAVPDNLVARAVPPSGRVVSPPPSPVEIKAPAAPAPPAPASVPPPPARPIDRRKPPAAPIPALAAPPMLFEKTPPPMQVPRQTSQLPIILGGGAAVLILLTLIVIVAVRKPAVQPVVVPPPAPAVTQPVVTVFAPDLAAPVVVAQAPDAAPSSPVVRDVGLPLRGADAPTATDSAAAAVGVVAPASPAPGVPAATGTARPPAGTPPSAATPVGTVAAAATTPAKPTGQPAATAPATATPDPTRSPGAAVQPPASGATSPPESTPPPEAKPPEPVKPSGPSPEEVMAEAKKAYVTGEKERAVELALQAAEKPGPHVIDAWRFVGSAACSIHNASTASRAYAHLGSAEHKQLLAELCQRNGLILQNGQFITVE
ncbi:MAG: serine/threonine protein kinase [Myxococcales bacterium]|nr:serine/threonine protein kinase [Myxococcales bacterium]